MVDLMVFLEASALMSTPCIASIRLTAFCSFPFFLRLRFLPFHTFLNILGQMPLLHKVFQELLQCMAVFSFRAVVLMVGAVEVGFLFVRIQAHWPWPFKVGLGLNFVHDLGDWSPKNSIYALIVVVFGFIPWLAILPISLG